MALPSTIPQFIALCMCVMWVYVCFVSERIYHAESEILRETINSDWSNKYRIWCENKVRGNCVIFAYFFFLLLFCSFQKCIVYRMKHSREWGWTSERLEGWREISTIFPLSQSTFFSLFLFRVYEIDVEGENLQYFSNVWTWNAMWVMKLLSHRAKIRKIKKWK